MTLRTRACRERVHREARERRARGAHEHIHVRGADHGAVAWPDATQRPPLATAVDLFTLYTNGALVGSARNTTDLCKSAHIVHSAYLGAASTLVFAVRTTNRRDVGTSVTGPEGLLFSALVTFSELASYDRLVMDGIWKVIEGLTRLDDVFGGETYDASYDIPGEYLLLFDDSKWNAATRRRSAERNARARPSCRRASPGASRPRRLRSRCQSSRAVVAEVGRVVASWVRLTVSGPKHYCSNNFQPGRYWLAGTGASSAVDRRSTPNPPTLINAWGYVRHRAHTSWEYKRYNASVEL
ncbi:hypothetical protein DFH09DRAFT_1282884 [Mycena vulgaris]|nr:hypothetical protein DFH09DRAFT_1282884 [Mycena vulgaris]